jgi:hypothetical protein
VKEVPGLSCSFALRYLYFLNTHKIGLEFRVTRLWWLNTSDGSPIELSKIVKCIDIKSAKVQGTNADEKGDNQTGILVQLGLDPSEPVKDNSNVLKPVYNTGIMVHFLYYLLFSDCIIKEVSSERKFSSGKKFKHSSYCSSIAQQ